MILLRDLHTIDHIVYNTVLTIVRCDQEIPFLPRITKCGYNNENKALPEKMIRFIYLEFANNEETKAEENSNNDETVVSTHKTMSVELKSK